MQTHKGSKMGHNDNDINLFHNEESASFLSSSFSDPFEEVNATDN